MSEELHFVVPQESRPAGIEYPQGFLCLVEEGCVSFSPWRLVDVPTAIRVMTGLKDRYNRELLPFAQRKGSDDFACFEAGAGETVTIINCYTSKGEETAGVLPSFWAWFRQAIEDMISFNS